MKFTNTACHVAVVSALGLFLANSVSASALLVSAAGMRGPAAAPISFEITLPDEASFSVQPMTGGWSRASSVEVGLFLSGTAPVGLETLVNIVDWDGRWYQTLLSGTLTPGVTNMLTVPVSGDAAGWEALGHHGKWNAIVMNDPREFRFRVFGTGVYTGAIQVVSASVSDEKAFVSPVFRNIRANTVEPDVFGLYELRFSLPDIYKNPFDTREVAVDAEITLPNGTAESQPAFYYQDYFRVFAGGVEVIEPQDGPEWRLRYSPRGAGDYSVKLKLHDGFGNNVESMPIQFTAVSAGGRGFIRPAITDPRALEFSTGEPYYPIGFNIRSPYDSRMDSQFPVRLRLQEGSLAYERYFRNISANGGNFAEVWLSAWCFGLEWSEVESGYHGAGWMNLEHAWELDRLFALAVKYDININFVLNNHGRLSAFSDREWDMNPYNTKNGGWLDDPIDWFSDENALRNYEDQLRYLIARYGWSRNIYAWELWSELDLVGKNNSGKHRDPRVVSWHRRISDYIDRVDLNDHLVSTHTCSNFGTQNPDLINLPGMKSIAMDAYHKSWNPLEISGLVCESSSFASQFKKPALITEFGGSPQAASARQLSAELHAAVWTAVTSSLSGTPMFWWWQVVEEYGLYPVYGAFSKFMKGEDRRDSELMTSEAEIRGKTESTPPVKCLIYASAAKAYGWIFVNSDKFGDPDAVEGDIRCSGLKLVYDKGTDGSLYLIEFWDTRKGEIVRAAEMLVKDGRSEVDIPEFKRDIAFKIRHLKDRL